MLLVVIVFNRTGNIFLTLQELFKVFISVRYETPFSVKRLSWTILTWNVYQEVVRSRFVAYLFGLFLFHNGVV